jgi:proton-dependent oligopeptide transporter, POT family
MSITDDTASEPGAVPVDITTIDVHAQGGWFGHPQQLARLFSTEAMERFGYYGMRALLSLYLIKHFLFNDKTSAGFYGGFTALVYLTPLIGGLLADRYLGSKRSVKFGALIMSLGYLVLCFSSLGAPAKPFAMIDGARFEVVQGEGAQAKTQFVVADGRQLVLRSNDDKSVSLMENGKEVRHVAPGHFVPDGDRSTLYTSLLLLGLSLVTIGNGFFKPNISTIVGSLYEGGDKRKDAGFAIFYMGINLGSLFSQILCPLLAVGMGSWGGLGWWAGFALAAIGMFVSWMLIQFDGGKLAGYGDRPKDADSSKDLLIYAAALLTVPIAWWLYSTMMYYVAPAAEPGFLGFLNTLPVMGKVLLATLVVSVLGILVWAWRNGSRTELEMMTAAMVLIIFNVVFWTLFEQAGSSLTNFADRNTDLSVFGLFSISAGQTQFFNAAFIVALVPLFNRMWGALAARNIEPSIPIKFGLALVGVGAGFLFLVWGATFVGPDYKVGLWWLAGLYLIHSIAELCISPVGLSMITKLSIARIVGLMMGVWFLSISFAQFLGGEMAKRASVETVGGQVTNMKVSLETYIDVYRTFGWYTMYVGIALLLLAWPLKKIMHGVK